tara:strand:- start:5351 stop:7192 length:1842 start_codon:yes stop_codon:yes gene_type:complete
MPKSINKIEDNQCGGRELITIPIEKNFISLRGLSPNRLRFEIEYGLERGSTANSFLITSDESNEKTYILIHPPGIAYGKIFLEVLQKHCSQRNSNLIVVIGHVNPNRVALLKELVDLYPKISLICSSPGGKLLKDIWTQRKPSNNASDLIEEKTTNPIPKIHLIKTQEVININNSFRLKLIPTPTARWPGELMVFEESLGLLMSDKLFGTHICTKEWEENTPSSTEEERRHYFDCLMASMSSQINLIVEQLEELDIRTIAPGHGPAIEGSWRSLLNDYRRWGEIKETTYLKVVLLFASAYGNTAAIADALAKGISRTGVKVNSINCEFASSNELIKEINEADGYLIGSPTLGGHAPTPIVSALGTLLAEGNRKKKVGIFGSYGWSGEALDLLENKLLDGGFSLGFDPIKVKFSPNALMVKTIVETGTHFGRTLLKEKRKQLYRSGGGLNVSKSDPAIIALGRIVGSLCILTACKESNPDELTGAMVASWVSQASFSPLGLSIAVAKDRAVENLLHKEDIFALNILSVKKHQNILKQFLQSFAPGENRLSGLNLHKSPNGQPVLPEALAWLEGCVKQRIECGDHWLIYAEIKHGKVLDPNGITAVHHRRTGANY